MLEPQLNQASKPKNGLTSGQPDQTAAKRDSLIAEVRDHKIDRHVTQTMRFYLLPILLQRADETCENCGEFSELWEIDHKEYGPHVTINELQLLCPPCHRAKTGREISEYARIRRIN